MKRIFLFVFFSFLITATNSFAEQVSAQIKNLPDNTMDVIFYEGQKEVARWTYAKDGSLAGKTGTVPDGVVKTYSAGLLVTRAQFENGELNGTSRDYYLKGEIRSKSQYKNGKLDGKLTVYYDDGPVHYVRYYRDGVAYGVMKEYWPNKKLKSLVQFNEGKAVVVEKYDRAGKLLKKDILEQGASLSPLETP